MNTIALWLIAFLIAGGIYCNFTGLYMIVQALRAILDFVKKGGGEDAP